MAADGVKAVGHGAKTIGHEAADKAEDAVGKGKEVGAEAADKAEDAKDTTARAAKKTGNWFKRGLRKLGSIF